MSTGNKLDNLLKSVLPLNNDNSKKFHTECICGFAIMEIKELLSKSDDYEVTSMHSLFENEFNWPKSVKDTRTLDKLGPVRIMTTMNFWSKFDVGWMNMHMQAALILGVLQGMDQVINKPFEGVEDYEKKTGEPADTCQIHLSRLRNDRFFGRNAQLTQLRSRWSRAGKQFKRLNQEQLTDLQILTGIAPQEFVKMEESHPFFSVKGYNVEDENNTNLLNIITCPLNNGTFVYSEDLGRSKFGFLKNRKDEIQNYTRQNINKLTKVINSSELNRTSKGATHEAFIFQKLNTDTSSCVDRINLPNDFEHGLCKLLVPSKQVFTGILNKDFKPLESDDITTIVDYWQDWCPMIAWKGPWLNEQYEPAPKMFNFSKSIIEIYGDEILNNGSLEFFVQPNEEFDGVFNTKKEEKEASNIENEKELKEDINQQAEEEKNSAPKEETNIAEQNAKAEQNINDTAEQQESEKSKSNDDDEDGEEEDGDGSSEIEEPSEIQELEDESIDIEESEEEKNCNKRRENLEEIYGTTGYKPTYEADATEMIANMMGHPHDIPCKHVLPYEITNGEVFLRDPPESVMKYTVKKITSEQLEVAGQDPNFDVFQIHFKNHMFDDEMDALYYIPAREMANEWDKFPNIMMKFCDFSDNNLGSKLNPGLVYTEFFKHFESFIKKDNTYNFEIETGASGPTGTLGSSTKEEFNKIMGNPSLQYIMYILRMNNKTGNDDGGFYDVIFQCWVLNNKYLMVKMSGTQLNYQVMINKYATEAKLGLIFAGMTDALKENFLDTNSAVVSIHKAKQLTFDKMVKICQLYKFTCTENSLDEDDGEPIDNTEAHFNVIAEEDNKFMFAMYSEAVEKEFSVRGFIHTRENIPVMNIFFTMDIFQSEYIIPLVNITDFMGYLNDIFHECYKHLYYMMEQIYLVEDPSTTEEELDTSEALGRYTMKKLVMTIFGMLSKKYVYGCVKTNKVAQAEKVINEDGEQVIDDSESAKKRLKWMQPEPFDNTGDFVMLRSNNLYKDHRSVCQKAEMQNPLLLQLYSTHLDDRNGYALTINNLDKSQKKDVKTTYHFVKYQDYAHMRVFENFIGNIFNQLFDSRPDSIPDEKEDNEEE